MERREQDDDEHKDDSSFAKQSLGTRTASASNDYDSFPRRALPPRLSFRADLAEYYT
jgi:hypothetical protein